MSTMEQLIQQVQLLTQKVTEQDVILNTTTANTTRFQLSASQVIKNFNDIKPFSGEDSYKVKSFFKAIENAEELCGTQNQELRSYCLRMMIVKINKHKHKLENHRQSKKCHSGDTGESAELEYGEKDLGFAIQAKIHSSSTTVRRKRN